MEKFININLIMVATMALAFIFALKYYKNILLINKFYDVGNKKNKVKQIKNEKGGIFKSFREKLQTYLVYKNKTEKYNTIYNLSLLILFGVFLLFLKLDSLFLAVLMPTLLYIFSVKIIEALTTNMDAIIRKDLPELINHMLKVFSKTNDLMIVLYESSKEMKRGPVRDLIHTLPRKMITQSNEKSLLEFAEKVNNIWIHSFAFLLINYKKTSKKEDIVSNLLALSKIMEERNGLSAKMIADRKPVVIVNYMLLVMGLIVFVGNLVYNPIMFNFILRTTTGVGCLVLGTCCFFLTILMNIKLVQEE